MSDTLTAVMLELPSLPLRAVETPFAGDSSGFGTSNMHTWFSTKHGRRSPAMPLIPFKSNTVEPPERSEWARMYHQFAYNRDDFLTLCVLIQAFYELGIESSFDAQSAPLRSWRSTVPARPAERVW